MRALGRAAGCRRSWALAFAAAALASPPRGAAQPAEAADAAAALAPADASVARAPPEAATAATEAPLAPSPGGALSPAPDGAHSPVPEGALSAAPERVPSLSGWALLEAEPPELVERLFDQKVALLDAPRDPGEPGAGLSRAYVVFEQPAARVFELLAATSRQREYRDELERIGRVRELADGCVDEHAIRILFVEMVYRLRYRIDPVARRILWSLDPSFANPIRKIEGFWEVYELGPTRSLGRFGAAVDVGEALPAWIEEAVTRKNLPKTLEGCRRWVDADGVAP